MKTDNDLIAVFMGLQINTQYGLEVLIPPDNPSAQGYWITPKYNTSWDWLMPVIEKIYSLDVGANVTIRNNKCIITIDKKRFACYTISPLNSTYHAVVGFIKYFNDKKL